MSDKNKNNTADSEPEYKSMLDVIKAMIAADGPMTMAQYMNVCLAHPDYGYYTTRDPFGENGDFITAPEISQMFGEMIGLWLAQTWMSMGTPNPVHLVEMGPGRGTLMADILRAAGAVPAFREALQVHFIEVSPTLRKAQQAKVPHAHWHDNLSSVPAGPTLLVANEFFDALPVHQYVKTPGGWAECLVMHDTEEDILEPSYGPSTGSLVMIPDSVKDSAQIGQFIETCPIAISIISDITKRLNNYGGAALVIDYGSLETTTGPTVQAVRDHHHEHILANPGNADITAHVDFGSLARTVTEAGGRVAPMITQGEFLGRLGIGMRAEQLGAAADEEQQQDIIEAVKRLAGSGEGEMGELFKVMAFTNKSGAPLAGFENPEN